MMIFFRQSLMFPYQRCIHNLRMSANREISTVKNDKVLKLNKKLKYEPVKNLSESTARIELEKLQQEINEHDHLYYVLASPIISDAVYDKLIQRASTIIGKFPSLQGIVKKLENNIGMRPTGKFNEFIHSSPMRSLDNAFEIPEISSFLKKIQRVNSQNTQFVIEPKIDGLSLVARYHYGLFHSAGTRGDGFIGENVTDTISAIPTIPKELPSVRHIEWLEIRGEVYIANTDFKKVNDIRLEKGLQKFATPRNAASGGLRLMSDLAVHRCLNFFAYNIFSLNQSLNDYSSLYDTQFETLNQLQLLGFQVASNYKLVEVDLSKESFDASHIFDTCKDMESNRGSVDFDADGCVIKVNNCDLYPKIGETSRFPKWAIAFKFSSLEKITKLIDIKVQVGRTGSLTPVAILEPIEIGGVIIERASLHNEDEVNRKGLYPGALVKLHRAGDVIPQIIEVVNDPNLINNISFKFKLPEKCPVCNSKTERKEGESIVRCTGKSICKAQTLESIRHFVSRDAADIRGLGPSIIEELHELGILKDISDIFQLRKLDTNNELSLRGKYGWGDKKTNNLLYEIDEKRTLTFERFLYGLGIRYVGLGTARLISASFISFQVFLDCVSSQDALKGEDRLGRIKGLGRKTISEIFEYFSNPESRSLFDKIYENLIIVNPSFTAITNEKDPGINVLEGKIIVFTGKLETMKRSEAQLRVQKLGAKVSSTITKDTNLIVAANNVLNTSKLDKARNQNIEVWSEIYLLDLLACYD